MLFTGIPVPDTEKHTESEISAMLKIYGLQRLNSKTKNIFSILIR
jgi:hypothetical protein